MSRLTYPSMNLELITLLRDKQRRLWIALAVAASVHSLVSQVGGFRAERSAVKPLTTQFVKRQPRLTKPLELKKRPLPKRRSMQRKMVAVKAKLSRAQRSAAFQPVSVLQSLSGPTVQMERAYGLKQIDLERYVVADVIEGSRDPKDELSMSLELMDVEALDTGRYHAMVIQDPNDRRGIEGFFHFYRAYPLSSIQNPGQGNRRQAYLDEAIFALNNLVNALNRYTDIRSDVKGSTNFDSSQLFDTPWIYHLGVDNFGITPNEAANLGKYMQIGGQLFVDTIWVGCEAPGDHSNRDMIRDALDSAGIKYQRNWSFIKLPQDHVIYHCFFDFDTPPAGGMEPFRSMGGIYTKAPFFDYLEGVMVGGRVMAIVSNKWYAKCWGAWGPGLYFPNQDNRRQLQFGVNIVVFALTQEGSITERVMDTVDY